MIAPSQSGRNSSDAIATLMTSFRQGNKAAATQLFELFYPELRRLAAARMRNERTEHTWEPTVLANELYLELIKIKALRPAEDRGRRKSGIFWACGSPDEAAADSSLTTHGTADRKDSYLRS